MKRWLFSCLMAVSQIVTFGQGLINVDFDAGTVTSKSGAAAVGQAGDFWNFYTRDDGHGGWLTFGALSNLKLADGSLTSAGLEVINAPGAWANGSSDPMYNGYIYPFSGNATINVTNLPAGSYDFLVYGLDARYRLTVAGVDYGTKVTTNSPNINPMIWQEGGQYIVFRNTQLAAGQTATITVSPGISGYAVISGLQIQPASGGGVSNQPPTITGQPAGGTIGTGTNWTFTVLASGSSPFSYQWLLNGSPISGATDYTLKLLNAQTNDSGNYQAVVSNTYGSSTSTVAVLTVQQRAPLIQIQPQDKTVIAGSSATFIVGAVGTPPLLYQWRKSGSNLVGATRSTLTLNNLQAPDAGPYSVRVFNRYGSITSSIATLTVTPSSPLITAQPVGSTMEAGTNFTLTVSAIGTTPFTYQWRLNGDALSGATMSSLSFNNIQTSDSGTYSVIVANSVGSTNSADAVVTVYTTNHPPVANSQGVSTSQNTSAPLTLTGSDPDNDPLTFAIVTMPGHGSLSGNPPDITYTPDNGFSGSDSFTFKVNDGTLDSDPATVSVTVLGAQGSGSLIAVDFGAGTSTAKSGPAAIGHGSTDFWNFYTRDDGNGGWLSYGGLANLKTVDNVATPAGLTIANAPGAWGNGSSDPMYDSYLYPFDGGNVTINVTNLPAGAYDLYAYGFEGSYRVSVGSTDYGSKSLPTAVISNPIQWQVNNQYAVFQNVAVASGQTLTLTVSPGSGGYAVISGLQLVGVVGGNHAPVAQDQSIFGHQDTASSITLTGADADNDPLTYSVVDPPAHGTLSGSAPNLSYTPAPGYSGQDSFTFKVNDGQLDSSIATVSINVLANGGHTLINVDFGAGSSSSEVGPAATGRAANDFWNFYTRDDGHGGWRSFGVLPGLKTSEGLATLAGLTVANAPGAWGNGAPDPMYDGYIYPFDGGNVTATVTNLDAGAYDVYVYGLDSSYSLSIANVSYGTQSLPSAPVSNPFFWQEGRQYVVFRQVQVASGSSLNLSVSPGSGGYAIISGMQISAVNSGPAVPPSISQQPASQTILQDGDVTFSVVAGGSSPMMYQWLKGSTELAGATQNSFTILHVQAADAGNYAVRITNPAGSILSSNATLTVTPVNHRPLANSQSLVTSQGSAVPLTLAGSDPDGDPLTFHVLTSPQHGTLSGTAPSLSYQPSAGYAGADSFTFTVNDGQTDSAPATVSITVLASIANALINVDFGAGTQSPESGPAAIGQTANDFWNFYTRDDGFGNYLSFGGLAHLKLADGADTGAGLTVANAPGAWGNGSSDPMYQSYIYPFDGGKVTVSVTNLPAGQYDVYAYGFESSYQLKVGSGDYGSLPLPSYNSPNPVVWQEGLQFVVFRNVQVQSGGDPLVLTVSPGSGGYAVISGLQIAGTSPTNHVPAAGSQSITVNPDTAKSVTLAGSDLDGDPLTYTVVSLPSHGTLTGTAPNLTYTPLAGYAGSDSFTFTVNDGEVDSAPGTINLQVLGLATGALINVDFGAGPSTTKVGLAATGNSTNDFWNFYTRDDGHGGWLTFGSMTNLKSADGVATLAGLTVQNAPGAWGFDCQDSMYAGYIYPFDGNATISMSQLSSGTYDIYVYGADGNYQVNVGATDYGIKTTASPGITTAIWHEGDQYVVFRGVAINSADQSVTLTVRPGTSGYAVISGMQIVGAPVSSSSNSPALPRAELHDTLPAPGDTNLYVIAVDGLSTSVVLDGSQTSDPNHDSLTYRWLENSLTPFASGVAATNQFAVGQHSVTLLVNDGKAASTAIIEFDVITIDQAIQVLAAGVEHSGLAAATRRQLQQVLIDNAGNSDALNLLAFQNKVQHYVAPMAPDIADELNRAAQHILDAAAK